MITLHRSFRRRLACVISSSILFSATLATASHACVTATSGGAWQNTAMTSQTGTFTATFDATPSASPTNSVIALSNGAQTAYANFACLARFNSSGQIDAYNGTAYAAASTINYSAGVSYHFRMAVNIGAKTYSIFVTPAGGSELTVGTNYAFRIADTTLNYWGVYVSSTSGGTGTDTVCNFSTGGTVTTYAITASAGSGGSISPSGTVTVNQAANQSFTITPNTGFNVSSVTVDGVNQGAITSYTFSNVQANHTISAAFQVKPTTFTITASAGSGGSISPSGTITVNQAANQTFTITPNTGFNVSSVTVDGANQGVIASYTFSNVQANHTISAAFQQQSSGEGPFGGTPAAIPGTVQAENYDTGGQGVAYNVTSINGTDNGYRSDGVDLETTTDTGGGVDLGWTTGGQWFKYTINVATAGTYTVSFRVAAPTAVTDAFHLANASGTNLSGAVNVPATGGWQTWATVTASVTLPAGQQILTLNQDNGGWNLNYASFATSGGTVATPVFSPGGGSYTSAQNVTISDSTGGASIRYTLDGSTPTSTTGTIYSGPVNISNTATLKAVAYESGFTTSAVTSGTYTISSGGTTTTGTINFHLLLGAGGSQDSLTLTGDNYTDLIMSNTIAGVLYGHLVEEYYPGIQFNKDYLYGSVFGELLQENIATQDYVSSSSLLDPSPNQQAVMGAGQGGPYQINNYAIDMVAGSYTPAGHSMINYIAVQKNIGYTMATASTQYTKPTPPSFNNKYYGPLLCAYFHYNDFVALNIIGKGPGGWTTPWEPAYDNALANFVHLPNSFLDMLLNAAYNQGYYGGLVASYSSQGATATASTVASVDSYSSVWGNSSTYVQYPYQVHYYMDQLYDNPIPTTSLTTIVTPTNHLAFNMTTFGSVFSNVVQTMDYSNGTNAAQYFTAAQAQTALNAALAQQGVSGSATLDFSNASDRAKIYAVIDGALSSLESTSGMKFNSTTNSQL
jgi:hypothetical protein